MANEGGLLPVMKGQLPTGRCGRRAEVGKSSFCNHHSKIASGENDQQMLTPRENFDDKQNICLILKCFLSITNM